MDIEGLYREVKTAMAVLYGAGQRDTAGADAFLRAVQEKPECVWMGLTYIPQAQSDDESLLLATMVKHALARVLAALDDGDKQAVFLKVWLWDSILRGAGLGFLMWSNAYLHVIVWWLVLLLTRLWCGLFVLWSS